MNEYMEFAQRHPILVMGFIAVLGMIIWTEFSRLTRKYKQLDVNQAVLLMNRDNTLVLDVREDKELNDGKIRDARHIALKDLNKRIAELDKNKDDPLLVYCRSGNRSGMACNMLTKAGFNNVNNLGGGFVAWEGANLPISKR
ncbi:MAG: rhodanese-like domain-containing protein [Thiolinea sp.]